MGDNVSQKIKEFFSQFKSHLYKKGEIMIRADDNPSGIYFIEEGFVKEYAISRKGEEIVLNIFKPGAFFPMTWGMNETPNRFFFEAVSQVKVYKAPREKVVDFLKQEPDVLFDLTSRLFKGLDGLLMRIFYLMSGSAYTRLITEILINVKRFGTKNPSTGLLVCKLTEKDLASETGMTRETISREIKKLKEKGLIDFHKNELVIKDLHRLEAELSDDFSELS